MTLLKKELRVIMNMFLVGLLLINVPLFIILQNKELSTKKVKRVFSDIFLLVISFLYIVLSIVIKVEPFDFEIMYTGDLTVAVAAIFVFSPFLWVVLYYFCRKLFKSIRVRKNAKIKSNKEYYYYRDDLNKISPSLVMFTSILETDVRKGVSATILKLKVTGYLQEINDELHCTTKGDNELLESEKIVLNSVKYNSFNERLYRQLVEKEALKYKYVKKNHGGKTIKTIKMLVTMIFPVILILFSMWFDNFVFENHPTPVLDGIRYVKINSEKAVDLLDHDEIDLEDYYHRIVEFQGQEEISYSYNYIKANKLKYSVVRRRIILNSFNSTIFVASHVMVFVAAFMLIEQIIYFKRNYRRTAKGKELLNKSYALKNFLREFSIIKDKTEEELILWEYYLIYAVILDVNVKIKDKVIEKYFSSIETK